MGQAVGAGDGAPEAGHQIADIRCHAAGAYQRLVREGAVHRANAAEKMGTSGTVGLPVFHEGPEQEPGTLGRAV